MCKKLQKSFSQRKGNKHYSITIQPVYMLSTY